MIEIIVAVILQITTILGGVNPDKDNAQQQEKSKTEKTEKSKDSVGNTAEGGAGTWDG